MTSRFHGPASTSLRFTVLIVFALSMCESAWLSASALAASEASGWEVTSTALPTHLPPDGVGHLEINLYNVGAAHSTGPVTVTDTLPPGVTMTSAGFAIMNIEGEEFPLWDCTGAGTSVVTCTSDPEFLPSIPLHLEESGEFVDTGPRVQIGIEVHIASSAEGTLANQVTVSGGGALAPASVTEPIVFSSTPVSSFEVSRFDGWFSSPDGTGDSQAGSHPYEATFSFDLNTSENNFNQILSSGGHIRHVDVNLPRGLVGNPTAVPQCPRQLLVGAAIPACPISTEVGFVTADQSQSPFDVGGNHILTAVHLPVYNMRPPPGVPAELGTEIIGIPVVIDASVRSGGDYGISAHINNLPQKRPIVTSSITLWGEPADPRHDFERFSFTSEGCNAGCAIFAERKPFLTMPTSCGTPQVTTMDVIPWESLVESTAEFVSHDSAHTPTGFSGCDHLTFKPSISVAPDTSFADTPAGLTVEVRVPQEGLLDPNGLATSNIKDTTVTLPRGVTINPGQAAGLGACQTAESGVGTEGEANCPKSSKVGTVQITTPLLKDKLEGDVYVLQANPPDLKLLVAASGDGVNLKLVGNVHLDEATGQLTTMFSETPELPFTVFKLSFSGGAQAAVSTPTSCGTYSVTSDFTPWSTKEVADVFPSSSFTIDHGAGGGPCPPTPLPFSPSLIAGSTSDQAGGFTNFSLLLQRPDDQQRISSLQFKLPSGLLGMLANVPLCPEPLAASGECPETSQIGHTVVEAGPGRYPLVVPQPGQPPAPIYLTGGYRGAPYGLSIKVPLVVGPFVLQTQIVRAKIEVDPRTAQLTVTTDPMPQIIDGVPADLRTINAVIDHPRFMINPTNCTPQSFSGTATSIGGALAPISTPFQVGSCRSLGFSPTLRAKTSGKTSKANGASLSATLSYPSAPPEKGQATSQANIRRVKVELPKQLPSRLTTLQKACTAAQFDSNPAGCPPASDVGQAVVHTPVLPVPLTGPAYFVSHGGEAFPSLIIVLQGYGVTVEIEATTFISKAGITSLTFKAAPDAPFSSFQLTSPQGPHSALTANNANLCAPTKTVRVRKRVKIRVHGRVKHVTRTVKRTVPTSLVMPTELVAQNGAVLRQNTRVSVTGCPKKAAPKASRAGAKKKSSASVLPRAARGRHLFAGRPRAHLDRRGFDASRF